MIKQRKRKINLLTVFLNIKEELNSEDLKILLFVNILLRLIIKLPGPKLKF